MLDCAPMAEMPTQTWCEESHVQIGDKLLVFRIEHALSRNDISWQTDTDNFHYCLEHQQDQMSQWWVRRGVIGESACEGRYRTCRDDWTIAVARSQGIQAIRCGRREETHCASES